MKPVGIYVHVPFCGTKCPYCDFYSCSYNKNKAEDYTEAVIKHIESFESIYVDTVYFGGGTPSLIPVQFIEKILNSIRKKFILKNPEITIEVNPCTVNTEKLIQYRSMGVNRLSVGIQSANENELLFLGRKHSFEKAEQVILSAYKIGFENISADLMIGLPYQTIESMYKSIDKLSALPINHISSYILKIEENTPFNKTSIVNIMPDEDTVCNMYLSMLKKLSENGFVQYEISNFSKRGYTSRHNLKYWHCEEYIGFGPMAHSFYNGKRYFNAESLDEYILSPQKITITDYHPGNSDEKIMLLLRLKEGIRISDFPEKRKIIESKAKLFEKAGLVSFNGERLSLTPKGFLLSNSIISEIIE